MSKIVKHADNYVRISDDRSYRQTEHVRVVEDKLNRKLGTKEVVHHKDENKSNNNPENLVNYPSLKGRGLRRYCQQF